MSIIRLHRGPASRAVAGERSRPFTGPAEAAVCSELHAVGGPARYVDTGAGEFTSRAVNAPGSQDQRASVGPPSVRRGGAPSRRTAHVGRGARIAHLEPRADARSVKAQPNVTMA